jgi:subtilase family serine protease
VSLAVAPDVRHLIVYNAPNDFTGQTELDEYTTIANQDAASTISSSWGVCENDVSAGYVEAENTLFEQMAMQGQSLFSSSGDTGAFGCAREVPDISAMADPYNGYAEYCTGNASTPFSGCATFSGSEPSPGWFAIGGTSLSSPLWSALIADRDGYTGHRSGNINPLLYSWFQIDPGAFFNDITGTGRLQQATNNGLYPTTPGYDEATGIGTPKFAAIITGF